MSPQAKPDIRDLSLEELSAYFVSIGEKSFRAAQAAEWIYQKHVTSFQGMKNIPRSVQEKLEIDFVLEPNVVAAKQVSSEGTTKFLFDLADHEKVESVLIPTAGRTTACISTQAGCKFGCKFCASGIGGWTRNLTCAEILAQVLHVKAEALHHQKPLSNIVFMGTGEPLDNLDNLTKAIAMINSPKGIGIGARHITISTVGIVPGIKALAKGDLQIELAVSLHGYDNASRNVLMPVNRKYPFDELIAACREYTRETKRQITFEYILIKDVTCTDRAVAALKKAFKGIICKMNLIPYNPVSEFGHQTPSKDEMSRFQDLLAEAGILATIRTPRGKDVNAACGQLRHAHKE